MSNSRKYSSSKNSQQTNKSILARKLVHEKLFVSNKWVFVLKVFETSRRYVSFEPFDETG